MTNETDPPAKATDDAVEAAAKAAAKAIKKFPFDDFGMDDVDPKSRYAEWVPVLARRIVAAAAPILVQAGRDQVLAGAEEQWGVRYREGVFPATCEAYARSEAAHIRTATVMHRHVTEWAEVGGDGDNRQGGQG